MKSLKQITDVAKSAGFLEVEGTEACKQIKLKSILPLGKLLYDNIRKVWKPTDKTTNFYHSANENVQHISKKMDPESYYLSEDFKRLFTLGNENFLKNTPLAVTDNLNIAKIPKENSDGESTNIYIEADNHNFLMCSYFVTEAQSKEVFFKIQRQRKIWWMKFSSNPGRFMFSDPKRLEINNRKIEQVSIVAKYPFGNIHLEDIQLIPLKILPKTIQSLYLLKDARGKNIIPTVIKTSMSLEVATVETLVDAIDSSDFNSICLHRSIAPYQCSIFNYSDDPVILAELQDLSKYIESILKNSNVAVFNSEKCSVTSLDSLQNECHLMDQIGIPYGIILNSDSLITGLMELRNRDTTLSETIHITDLPNYLLQIVKL